MVLLKQAVEIWARKDHVLYVSQYPIYWSVLTVFWNFRIRSFILPRWYFCGHLWVYWLEIFCRVQRTICQTWLDQSTGLCDETVKFSSILILNDSCYFLKMYYVCVGSYRGRHISNCWPKWCYRYAAYMQQFWS